MFYLCAPLLAWVPFWSRMKNAGNFTNYMTKKASGRAGDVMALYYDYGGPN